jgi:cysteine desulfurase
MIYLDNSATTRPWRSVLDTYIKVSESYFGNPSSLHPLGGEAEKLLDQSRAQTAALLGVNKKDIIFTSGATEANNLAVKGTAEARKHQGSHIITTAVEHPSVLEAAAALEQKGWEVTRLNPDKNGEISPEQVEEALRMDTVLVSCMHVNNETGSIHPVEKIGECLKKHPKVLFHVDYVQGIGKVPLSMTESRIDLLTISGHKFHCVKGTGVLAVRRGRLEPLFHGGTQENRLRAGTENTAGAAALAKAMRLLLDGSREAAGRMRSLNLLLEEKLSEWKGVEINSPKNRAPHILNFSVAGIKPETVVQALAQKEIYISTTSACSSKQGSGSRVLQAMPLPKERSETALRISLSEETTREDIDAFLLTWQEVYETTARKGKQYEI